ncbi:aminotransferase class V [Ktedonobacter sp. SOSP1-52]|uniref:aminotransferase class V-fold PLP-dependent enzyme n=1 Tax=Ktedonobacter sp. SOSP1-52 TaxID=2778366 RepID=UPI00191574A3|nr:aminotransferase class V-fold PLP-dependent enzyme [Ktedonobacter sp. SOSP1-52]GHO67099.1 aminotransferase class V [Ktedonobacter sp. SOSP1-52]
MPFVFDVQRAREETPGCANVLHFNNAGASLLPEPVLSATLDHLRLEAQIGGYEAADHAQEQSEHTYDAIATLLHCSRDEVALIENATRAWDMAFYGMRFQAGDRILTSIAEYASNYIAYLQVARKTGAVVEPIPNDKYGQVDIEALQSMLDERVKLISVTHVPTNGGLVNPVQAIGKLARQHHIPFLVDACQSVGQMPIDVEQIGCDMLSATGRKYLRGPRGTGFLYVRRAFLEQLEPPMLDLHAATWTTQDSYEMRPDARRFENWEGNVAGRIGLGVAVDYALNWGLENIWRRLKALAYQLRTQLSPIPGVVVHDRGVNQCGIVTFTIEGITPEEIKRQLAAEKINVSISDYNSTLLDMESRHLNTMVRASLHYYNTEEEIERFCKHIDRMAETAF